MKNIPLIFILLALLTSITLFGQVTPDDLIASPEQLFELAQAVQGRNNTDMALFYFNKYIEKYPEGKDIQAARLSKIVCLEKLNRTEELLAEINTFRKLFPEHQSNESLTMRAVDLLLHSNKPKEAISHLDELFQSKNEAVAEYAAFTKAKLLLSESRVEEAGKLFKTLAEKPIVSTRPYRAYAASEYAFILVNAKQLEKALERYQILEKSSDTPAELKELAAFNQVKCHQMLNHTDQTLQLVEQFIVNYSNSKFQKEARKIRILASSEKRLFKQTVLCCEEWGKRFPDSPDFEVDYAHAFALLQCKRHDEAVPFFERAASAQGCPQRIVLNCRYNLVFCLLTSTHYVETVKAADLFLSQFPKSTLVGFVLRWKAVALEKQNQLPEATESYKKALSFFSESPEEYINIAENLIVLYSSNKQWEEAASIYRRMAGNHTLKNHQIYLLYAADAVLRAGDLETAITDLKKAIDGNDPEISFKARLRLAELMMESGHYTEAIAQYQTLLPLAEKETLADIQARIVKCHFELKEYAKAETAAEAALKNPYLKGEKRTFAEYSLATILLTARKDAQVIPVLESLLKAPTESVAYMDARFLFAAADACMRQNMPVPFLACMKRITELPDTPEENKIRAHLRIISDLMLPRNQFKPAEKQLNELQGIIMKQAEKYKNEQSIADSLFAEVYMKLNQPDKALIYAERVLVSKTNDETSQARALYVRAHICLHNEKRYETANQFATHGYIVINHPTYTPLMMEISIRALLAQNKRKIARDTLNELRTRFPEFLARHPEISSLIPDK